MTDQNNIFGSPSWPKRTSVWGEIPGALPTAAMKKVCFNSLIAGGNYNTCRGNDSIIIGSYLTCNDDDTLLMGTPDNWLSINADGDIDCSENFNAKELLSTIRDVLRSQ